MSSTQRELFTLHVSIACFYNQYVTASILIYSAVLWSTLSPIFSRHYLSSVLHKILCFVRWCFLNVKCKASEALQVLVSTSGKHALTFVPSVETKVAEDTLYPSHHSLFLLSGGVLSGQSIYRTRGGEEWHSTHGSPTQPRSAPDGKPCDDGRSAWQDEEEEWWGLSITAKALSAHLNLFFSPPNFDFTKSREKERKEEEEERKGKKTPPPQKRKKSV